jgi:hypothetical protein
VVITCPACERRYVIAESHLGRNIVCLWCQHRFRVAPAGERVGAHDDDAEIVISCPSCGFQRSTTSAFAGQAVGCPQCRALFVAKAHPDTIEVPAPMAWPIVLALGITLLAAGVATNPAFSVVGAVLGACGLVGWVQQLLPKRGHTHEPLREFRLRAQPVEERPGSVDQLRPGAVGYRFRLPEKVHPISAGVKGGIIGGLVMPIPAVVYGVLSGHGIWFPINLLAGMVLPGVEETPVAELEQFRVTYFVVALVIHMVFSVGFGLLYGVVLPTLPKFPGSPLLWGGLLMPLFWSGAAYAFMGVVNPVLRDHVDWPWFVLSQFVYGIAMSLVVFRSEQVPAAQVPGRSAFVR